MCQKSGWGIRQLYALNYISKHNKTQVYANMGVAVIYDMLVVRKVFGWTRIENFKPKDRVMQSK